MLQLSHKHRQYLKLKRDENGNYIFSFRFAEKLPKGPLVEVKRLSKKETAQARKIYKRTYESTQKDGTPTHRLLGYLAFQNKKAHQNNQQGPLDGKLTEEQIKAAEKNIIPDGFEIHHLHQIALGGGNEFNNLFLVSKEVHQFLHLCMDCILAYIPYKDEKRPNQPKFFIQLPLLDKCMDNSCGLCKNTPENTAGNAGQKASENTAQHAPENGARKDSENTAQHAPENTGQYAPRNAGQKASKNTGQKALENTARKTPVAKKKNPFSPHLKPNQPER